MLIGSVILIAAGPCDVITNGGYLTQNVFISKSDSPCVIHNDLIIAVKYKLTLAPGVELRFMPGVMLAVNGTFLATVGSVLSTVYIKCAL